MQRARETQQVEINGVAHIQISVDRYEECVAFYDQIMPYLGLKAVHRSDQFVYYVGGRTAYNVSRAAPQHAGERHVPTRSGLHHIRFRARSREDIDEFYGFLQGIDATMVRAPEEGPWAPGYYSLSFLDPDGIRRRGKQTWIGAGAVLTPGCSRRPRSRRSASVGRSHRSPGGVAAAGSIANAARTSPLEPRTHGRCDGGSTTSRGLDWRRHPRQYGE